jgi:hypothetical protein
MHWRLADGGNRMYGGGCDDVVRQLFREGVLPAPQQTPDHTFISLRKVWTPSYPPRSCMSSMCASDVARHGESRCIRCCEAWRVSLHQMLRGMASLVACAEIVSFQACHAHDTHAYTCLYICTLTLAYNTSHIQTEPVKFVRQGLTGTPGLEPKTAGEKTVDRETQQLNESLSGTTRLPSLRSNSSHR